MDIEKREPGRYGELLSHISTVIEQARKQLVRHINVTLVGTYWQIGKWIVESEQQGRERATYGDALMKRLSLDLTKRFGRGWSRKHLLEIRQFYLIYRFIEKVRTPCAQLKALPGRNIGITFEEQLHKLPLSWSHYRLLMKFGDDSKRRFYESESIRSNWSARQLSREINSLLYERTSLSKRKELVLAKANTNPIVTRPEDEVKESYVLDFLGLKDEYSESDLEDALIRHLESFLLELGRGFAFVARQKRFALDGDEYRIDLLLYHIALRCYIVIELKIEKFKHSHAGQINFYVNWVKENIIPQAENDPVGLIICLDKNNTTVRYATGGLSNKIFVSNYLLKLPKPEDLQRELERGRELFLQRQLSYAQELKGSATDLVKRGE